jgi:hypothetical protein
MLTNHMLTRTISHISRILIKYQKAAIYTHITLCVRRICHRTMTSGPSCTAKCALLLPETAMTVSSPPRTAEPPLPSPSRRPTCPHYPPRSLASKRNHRKRPHHPGPRPLLREDPAPRGSLVLISTCLFGSSNPLLQRSRAMHSLSDPSGGTDRFLI